MIYVISDLHGERASFSKLLDKINFRGTDTMYVLGDIVDRGPEPIRLLQDLACRSNVYPLLGNHDFLAHTILSKLSKMPADGDIFDYLEQSDEALFEEWMSLGGNVTLKQFLQLDEFDREDVLDYFTEFTLFEEIEVNGINYVLVHAGLDNFTPDRPLEDYHYEEMIFHKPDYSKKYFEDKILVTGHTPTAWIDGNKPGEIYKENNHICIDLSEDKKTAALRLDDGEVFTINY